MKLNEFIKKLQKLEDEGHGNLEVFYRHGSSGDCGPLGSPRHTKDVDDCGPFDLEDEYYISIYAGY